MKGQVLLLIYFYRPARFRESENFKIRGHTGTTVPVTLLKKMKRSICFTFIVRSYEKES